MHVPKNIKRFLSLVLAMIMAFSAFTVFAADYPLRDSYGQLLSDGNTYWIADFTQEGEDGIITATVYIENRGNATIYLSGAAVGLNYTSAVAPINQSGAPYYGAELNGAAVTDYITEHEAFIGNGEGNEGIQNQGTYRFIGKAASTGVARADQLVLAAGERIQAFQMRFTPTNSNPAQKKLDIDRMFYFRAFQRVQRVGVISNYLMLQRVAVLPNTRALASTRYTTVIDQDNFRMQQHQPMPEGLSANVDARLVDGYDDATMEWTKEDPTNPSTVWFTDTPSAADVGPDETIVYVRTPGYTKPGTDADIPEIVAMGSDLIYTDYKDHVASEAVPVEFLSEQHAVEPGDLVVEKTGENQTRTDGTTHVGDTISYSVLTTNNGHETSVAGDAVMTDKIAVGVDLDESTIQINGVAAVEGTDYTYDDINKVLTVQLGNIAAGAANAVEVTFDVTVNESAYDPIYANITNTAAVNAKESDRPGAEDLPEVSDTEEPEREVVGKSEKPTIDGPITKGDDVISGGGSDTPGSTVDIVIRDDEGNEKAVIPNVPVEDGQWTVDDSNPDFPELEPGDEIEAIQTEPGKDPSDPVTETVINRGASALRIEKTSRDDSNEELDGLIHVGDNMAYTIDAFNDATDPKAMMRDVTVTDTLPVGVTLDPDSLVATLKTALGDTVIATDVGAFVIDENGFTFTLDELYGGQRVEITFVGTVNEAAYEENVITNTGYVTAIDDSNDELLEDSDSDDDDGPGTPIVRPRSERPTINNSEETVLIFAGDSEISGTGVYVPGRGGSLIQVTITDDTDPENPVEYGPMEVYVRANGTWMIDEYDGVPELGPNWLITATQTTPGMDESEAVDTRVNNRGAAELAIEKTVENNTREEGMRIGDALSYEISVGSIGGVKSIATDVVVTDTFPNGITVDQGSVDVRYGANDALVSDAVVSFEEVGGSLVMTVALPDMPVGTEINITFDAEINETAIGTTVNNSAQVVGKDNDDEDIGDDDDDDNEEVVPPRSEQPEIDPIIVGDRVVTGNGVPGAEIVVSFEDGPQDVGPVIVDDDGNWTVDIPSRHIPQLGDEVTAVQTEPGLSESLPTVEIVQDNPVPDPEAAKSHSASEYDDGFFRVGDIITYTLTAQNNSGPRSVWTDVEVSDIIPEGLRFIDNTVRVDGVRHAYVYDPDTRELIVGLGDIVGVEEGEEANVVTVTFDVELESVPDGPIVNMADFTGGDNGDDPVDEPDVEDEEPIDVRPVTPDPIPDPVAEEALGMTGLGEPGAEITVQLPNGDVIENIPVDENGEWGFEFANEGSDYVPMEGDEILVSQQLPDYDPSNEVPVIVTDKAYRSFYGRTNAVAYTPLEGQTEDEAAEFLAQFEVLVELRDGYYGETLYSTTSVWEGEDFTDIGMFEFEDIAIREEPYTLVIQRPGYLKRVMDVYVTAEMEDGDQITPPTTMGGDQFYDYEDDIFVLVPGDANDDNFVTTEDVSYYSNSENTEYLDELYDFWCDFNADGNVDDDDYAYMERYFGFDVYLYEGTRMGFLDE